MGSVAQAVVEFDEAVQAPWRPPLTGVPARRGQLRAVPAPAPATAVQPTAEITMTHREIQTLNNLAEGRTSPEIGAILNVSSNTVDWYVASLQAKLKARNRNHAVALAFRQGLIT